MSTYHFRKAATSEVKPLIGLYAESGRGKTKSALLLAKGFAGDMSKVGMIDTEAGRGEAYANDPVVGGYNVLPLRENFAPKEYGKAIAAAEREGMRVLIVDSASHEWEGVGGVLAMAAENQAGGAKGPLVWQKPKIEHSREFMLRFQQTPIPLVILCMRAKYPMMEAKAADVENWDRERRGKPPKVGDWVRSDRLEPKQSDDILFEMLVHAWIDEEHRAHVTKYTIDALRDVFIDGQPITVETGQRLLGWTQANNKAPPKQVIPSTAATPSIVGAGPSQEGAGGPAATTEPPVELVLTPSKHMVGEHTAAVAEELRKGAARITPDQARELALLCTDNKIKIDDLCSAAGVQSLDEIPAAKLANAHSWIDRVLAKRNAK